jgi:hypothetical protein
MKQSKVLRLVTFYKKMKILYKLRGGVRVAAFDLTFR